jgi:hypothetical protein
VDDGGAVVGLLDVDTTGPFRVQQPGWAAATEARRALAEQWAGLVSLAVSRAR